jgi:DGQHR domain-containing protein
MPLGGLINARSDNTDGHGGMLEFEPDTGEAGTIQSGWLSVPDRALPLWIVDMQHRLGGFERAIFDDQRHDLGNFPVVATIADGLSKMEEIEQFELINTTQKKVRTDLARRLMSVQAASDTDKADDFEARGLMWQARGPVIADWLNKQGTVWHERIQPPNKSKREMPNAIMRETSLVTSLKPILNQPLFSRMDDEQVAKLIDRYWSAVKEIFPESFQDPAEYVIQKTPGVFSLHLLLPEVVELIRSKGMDLTAQNMVLTMAPWRELDDDYWMRGNDEGASRFGSMAGFSRLATELRKHLPKLDLGL